MSYSRNRTKVYYHNPNPGNLKRVFPNRRVFYHGMKTRSGYYKHNVVFRELAGMKRKCVVYFTDLETMNLFIEDCGDPTSNMKILEVNVDKD